MYNYVVLLIFLGCAQALASGQPLIHVCLCFVLLCLHFRPCLQLLTDKLVRQCKWVWPARLGEGRGRGEGFVDRPVSVAVSPAAWHRGRQQLMICTFVCVCGSLPKQKEKKGFALICSALTQIIDQVNQYLFPSLRFVYCFESLLRFVMGLQW